MKFKKEATLSPFWGFFLDFLVSIIKTTKEWGAWWFEDAKKKELKKRTKKKKHSRGVSAYEYLLNSTPPSANPLQSSQTACLPKILQYNQQH
jgi:hypothetical protein